VLLRAFAKLHYHPDLIFVEGHDYPHPRRFGIANHLGVVLHCPTVGCAKSILPFSSVYPKTWRPKRVPLQPWSIMMAKRLGWRCALARQRNPSISHKSIGFRSRGRFGLRVPSRMAFENRGQPAMRITLLEK
jgi:deoxyinosine 3'endonuclease (endonuclease V)